MWFRKYHKDLANFIIVIECHSDRHCRSYFSTDLDPGYFPTAHLLICLFVCFLFHCVISLDCPWLLFFSPLDFPCFFPPYIFPLVYDVFKLCSSHYVSSGLWVLLMIQLDKQSSEIRTHSLTYLKHVVGVGIHVDHHGLGGRGIVQWNDQHDKV